VASTIDNLQRVTGSHLGDVQARAFMDPRREGRRIFAEAWGTFLLVVVARSGRPIHSARSTGGPWPRVGGNPIPD